MPKQVNIVTVVWGAWHTDTFLSACLPSLFAEGNLPALAHQFDCCYRIITSGESAAAIRASRAFALLEKIVTVELIVPANDVFNSDTLDDAIRVQNEIWQAQIERCRSEGAIIILMGPDVVTADGSLRHLAQLFGAGKQVVYAKAVRVVDETARPCLSSSFGVDGVMRIHPRQLVRMIIEHLHPLTAFHMLGSGRFSFHSELLIRPIGRQGFVMRLVLSDGFAFDMSRVSVHRSVMAESAAGIAIACDSDEFTQVSLSPLCKDADWYLLPNPTTPATVARFWAQHDNPSADTLIDVDFVFRASDIGEADLRQASRELASFVDEVRPRRDILRVWRTIAEESGYSVVRHALAAAFFGTAAEIGMGCRQPFTFFLPDDEAMQRLPPAFLDALMNSNDREAWKMFISDHVMEGAPSSEPSPATNATLSGRLVRLRRDNGASSVNGVPLSGEPRALLGGNLIWPLASGQILLSAPPLHGDRRLLAQA